MQTLLLDLRYSLRQFVKNPGFTLTAMISLALGIGATTAVFSVIYAALMNPYPYPAADRIVRLTVAEQSGAGELGQSERSADPASAAIERGREPAGHGLPRPDSDRA